MKVAVLVEQFPRSSQPFVVNHVTGLLERGFDVRVFATGYPDDGDRANADAVDFDAITTYTPIPLNKLRRVLELGPLLARYGHADPVTMARVLDPITYGTDALSLRPAYRLAPMLGDSFDIVHSHFGPKGRVAAVLKQAGFDGQFLTSFHGFGVRQASSNPARYRRLFESGDYFLANSRHTYDQLCNLGVDKDRLLHHPLGLDVDAVPFKWSDGTPDAPDPVKLVTVARLVADKGVEYALEAVAELRERTTVDFEYHVVGDGEQRTELEYQAANLGISDTVVFHGHRNRESVFDLLADSHVFVLPSLEEAFGMVLLEAQAVGLPVVATDVGGIPEAVSPGESAFLVPPRDSSALASELKALIERPGDWPAIGERGRAHAEANFDISDVNDRMASLYEDIVDDGVLDR